MIVGVVDIGSNTARLLVAHVRRGRVEQLRRERVYLRLGDDIHAYGAIGRVKLDETGKVAKRFVRLARKAGAGRIQTIVTAPARQADNGAELIDVLAARAGSRIVPLSGDDEGRLAWAGAVARMTDAVGVIAVVDLGGGSTELAVGDAGDGPTWVRSADAGALRVTREYLAGGHDRSGQARVARGEIARLLAPFVPPRPDAALVVGGTARAIGRVLGPRFDREQLEALVEILEKVPGETLVRSHGVSAERAHTLLGGTLVLAEMSRRLDSALEVAGGGLREGAALELAREAKAVA